MTSQNPEVFEGPNEPQATNPIRMRRAIRTECSAVMGCGVSRAIATGKNAIETTAAPLEEYLMRDIFPGRSKALPIVAANG
jgi:hypothetical protein